MKNFKEYIISEDANLWIANAITTKYKNGNLHADLSDKEFKEAIKLYKEANPHEIEGLKSISKEKVREIIKKRNNVGKSKEGSLTSLAQEGDYKKLSTELEKLKDNKNIEIQKKVNAILPKVNQLAASVVTEDENEEELRQAIINACKEIDDLTIRDNNTVEDREHNVAAQTKMKEVYKQLYEKYAGGDYKNAAAFLNKVAEINNIPKTLSFEEFKQGWEKITARNKFAGAAFQKDDNLIKGVKFLIGCLCLRLVLKSNIFNQDGTINKDLEKEGIKNDASVNAALKSLKIMTVDKSLEENFKDFSEESGDIRSSEGFLKGLEGLFRTLERLAKPKPEQDLATKDNTPPEKKGKPEDTSQTPEKSEDGALNTSKDELDSNSISDLPSSDSSSKDGTIKAKNTEGTEETGKAEEKESGGSTVFKISPSDNAEVVKQKVDAYFGDGTSENRGSLFNYFKEKIEKLKGERLKSGNSGKEEPAKEGEEEVKEDVGIYDLVDEKIINERLGAFIKNKAGIANVGRLSLNSDRAQGAMSKMFDVSIKDMEDYQIDFAKKAQKYCNIIASPIEGTRKQIASRSKLNILAITYKSRLADCFNHAVSRSRYNEIGLTGKEIGDDFKKMGKGLKNFYDNETTEGKTAKLDNERLDRVSEGFNEIWDKLDEKDKALFAYGIERPEADLYDESVLMINKNGTLVPAKTPIEGITELALSNGYLNVKNQQEVVKLLGKIQDTNWYKENQRDIKSFSDKYESFRKAYVSVCSGMHTIFSTIKAELNKAKVEAAKNKMNNAANQSEQSTTPNAAELANQAKQAAAEPMQTTNQTQEVAGMGKKSVQTSVITESKRIEYNDAKEVVEKLSNGKEIPELSKEIATTGLFGDGFGEKQIYNGLCRWSYEQENKKSLNTAYQNIQSIQKIRPEQTEQPTTQVTPQVTPQVQATVTTSAVGGYTIPNRMYTKAIRRRIDKFAF